MPAVASALGAWALAELSEAPPSPLIVAAPAREGLGAAASAVVEAAVLVEEREAVAVVEPQGSSVAASTQAAGADGIKQLPRRATIAVALAGGPLPMRADAVADCRARRLRGRCTGLRILPCAQHIPSRLHPP